MQSITTAPADCKSNSSSRRHTSQFGRAGASNFTCWPRMYRQGRGRACEQCHTTFSPRTGGRPQRFCSVDCRRAFHDKPQRDNVHVASRGLPAVIDPPKAPASGPEAKSDFDWGADDSVVLHHQPAVAVYINQAGGLTIRQERSWDQDEDIIIAIAPENVGEFIDKLTDIVGIPSVGKP